MENRKRNVHLHVMVTPDELAAIHERMAEAGISNAGAYVRKMALNGYILHIDLAPVKDLISLQRRCSNNLNQVAVHAHTYGVYPEEIDGLKRDYVTAAWRGGECEVMEQAAKYCRIVYDAGYSPICPMLYLPLFLNDAVPEEHKSGIDMGRDLLRRSRVLVVCGSYVNEAVKNDIAVAQRLGITATTLDGILTVKGQRRR